MYNSVPTNELKIFQYSNLFCFAVKCLLKVCLSFKNDFQIHFLVCDFTFHLLYCIIHWKELLQFGHLYSDLIKKFSLRSSFQSYVTDIIFQIFVIFFLLCIVVLFPSGVDFCAQCDKGLIFLFSLWLINDFILYCSQLRPIVSNSKYCMPGFLEAYSSHNFLY